MKASLHWLSEYIDLSGRDIDSLSDLMTFAGIEVEGIEQRGIDSDLVVVAEVLSADPHPDADRLKVCQVEHGAGEPRQIVCGATNYQVGDKIPLALPGAVLPGDFTIKAGKVRGVVSNGMMCSGSELGLSDDHEGLLILPTDTPVGVPLREVVPADTVFELEITPNRPDLLSHFGLARDLSALTGQPLLKDPVPQADPGHQRDAAAELVELRATNACPYYSLRRIRGVKVGPSPEWLQQRLKSVGLRPINNVADITNYVLMAMGQPLHAFDGTTLEGGIIVRPAEQGETLQALDEQTYTLNQGDLVIADHKKAVALGGIMGGESTGVTEATTDIWLEAAWFEPAVIRRSARRLGITSDSSYRFERGVDPLQTVAASEWATQLILELAGGSAEDTVWIAGQCPRLVATTEFDPAKAVHLMGGEIQEQDAIVVLDRLGLKRVGLTCWAIPSWRLDLQREVDLMEEVSRVIGLDKVPSRVQTNPAPPSEADAAYDFERRLHERLSARGWHEVRCLKLVSASEADHMPGRQTEAVPLKNPLSEDLTHLRPGLAAGLLNVLERNIRLGADAHAYAETGTVFAPGKDGAVTERQSLGLLLSGPSQTPSWSQPEPAACDIHDLRATLEYLCPLPVFELQPAAVPGLVLSGKVRIGKRVIGWIGQLPPARARELDAGSPVYLAELDLLALRQMTGKSARFGGLPKFPSSRRDVALEMAVDLPQQEIATALARAKEPLLESVRLFDVFTDASGEKMAKDRKSLAYALTYRAPDRTLESAEVDTIHQNIVQGLLKKLPLQVR